ncbi:MAG TPA: murein transglycosylase domain-containing protein [Nitrospirales bacterium]|nr:murein transglycosylase domain-containing protein [Nitrospirales bacterium]
MRSSPFLLFAATALLAFTSGCETAERALNTAEKAVGSGTGHVVRDLLESKNAEEMLKHRAEGYARNPDALLRDLQMVQRDFNTVMAALSGNVKKKWGEKEVKLPDRTVYVKYTQNYRSRAVVDFDRGEILVETVDEQDPTGSLKKAIVTTVLTPNDPRSVDVFTDKAVPLTGEQEPYLLGLVHDEHGDNIRKTDQAERFAGYLVEKKLASRAVEVKDGDRIVQKTTHVVKMPMVANFEQKKAEKYRASVTRFAEQYKVSPSLVFAIIRTESNFNPFAVSAVPAYGLMQLVPSTGGRDAYRRAKGSDTVPSKDYLLDGDQNIELGAAYLNVLAFNQLEHVSNPVSREYCVIAAYNTGAGNVYRTFSKNQQTALAEINRLEPGALYDRLRAKLPYDETRQYLLRVVTYRKGFIAATASTTESK